MENVLQDLVTCDAKSALDTQSKYVHIADLKECQQVIDKTSTCTIQHDYTAGVIEHVDGDFNMKSCGEGCIEIWLGTVCNDCLHGGSCSLFVKEIRFRVVNPDALIKAEIDYAVSTTSIKCGSALTERRNSSMTAMTGNFLLNLMAHGMGISANDGLRGLGTFMATATVVMTLAEIRRPGRGCQCQAADHRRR